MADFEELVRGAAADVAPEDTVGARSPGKLSLTSALARRTPRPVRDAAMAPATEARLERAIGDGGDDAPAAGVPYLARDLVPSSTLGRMEAGLGQSFGDVRMVADSSALGSAHAATRGEEVQFAPGKFAPGTATGDWLLAHELSHVVQQRQGSSDALQAFAPRTRRGVLEREADAAADAVVSGGRAQIVHGAEAGVEQRYEAWEHADLGNLGADAGDEMLIPYGNPPRYITYGQLVALSGDFYASAGEMHHDMDANPDTIDRVRGVMDEERRAAAGGTGRVWDERAGGYVDVEGRPADHGYIDWLFDWAKPGGGSANHHAEEFGGVGAVGAGAAARGHGHNHGDDTADRDLSRWRPPGEEGHDDHEGHEGHEGHESHEHGDHDHDHGEHDHHADGTPGTGGVVVPPGTPRGGVGGFDETRLPPGTVVVERSGRRFAKVGDTEVDIGPMPAGNLTGDPTAVSDGPGHGGGTTANTDQSMTELAQTNSSHFSPENIRDNWRPKQKMALDRAKDAYEALQAAGESAPASTRPAGSPGSIGGHMEGRASGNPTSGAAGTATGGGDEANRRAEATATRVVREGRDAAAGVTVEHPIARQAIILNAFGAHFLTDAFASGHLISGVVGREAAVPWWIGNLPAIKNAVKLAFQASHPDLYAVANATGQYAKLEGTVFGELSAQRQRYTGLLLKVAHDSFNASGLMVKNPEGGTFMTYGDGNMARSPAARLHGQAATAHARTQVMRTMQTGEYQDDETLEGGFGAMRFVPDQVQPMSPPGAGFRPVGDFAQDPAVFHDQWAARCLAPTPGANRVYDIIEGNLIQLVRLLPQGGQDFIQKATGVLWEAYNKARGLADGARSLWNQYGQPVVDGARALPGRIADGARSMWDRAWAWGGRQVDRARDAGSRALERGGELIDGARDWGGRQVDRARDAGSRALERGGELIDGARDWGGRQVDRARDAGSRAMERGGELIDGARAWGGRQVDRVRDAGSRALERGGELVDGAREAGSRAVERARAIPGEVADGARSLWSEYGAPVVDGARSMWARGSAWVDERRRALDRMMQERGIRRSEAEERGLVARGTSDPNRYSSDASVDRLGTGADGETRQLYAHGAFMGAAGAMMRDATWNGILRRLQPAVHARAAAATEASQLQLILENNPVLMAYGEAESIRTAGGDASADPNRDPSKVVRMEWDVWLDQNDPGNLSLARIAHGDETTTKMAGANPRVLGPLAARRADVADEPNPTSWMGIYGAARSACIARPWAAARPRATSPAASASWPGSPPIPATRATSARAASSCARPTAASCSTSSRPSRPPRTSTPSSRP
jgi:hypothetical protein